MCIQVQCLMWWYKQNVREEIITTGTGEHTNIFHLLLSLPLLSSDFLLYPQGYKFKRAENQHSLSCSEKQTKHCHWNALFFFLLESRHTHLLVASHWHTLNAQSKVLPWCCCAGFCRGSLFLLGHFSLRATIPASCTSLTFSNFSTTAAQAFSFFF